MASSDSDSMADPDIISVGTPSKRKKCTVVRGAATYHTKFNKDWTRKYLFLQPVKQDSYSFHCTICNKTLSCKHQGEADVSRHAQGTRHLELSKKLDKQNRITFSSSDGPLAQKIITAEVKISTLLAQHNVPIAVADHLSPMIRSVFDGDVAKGFSCARTKTTAILNGAVAPAFKRELIEAMQHQPFTLATDGSNDTGLLKMNPITVKIFDTNRHRIDTRFLDMGTTDGVNAATSAEIFSKIEDVLRTCNVSWNNCVGFSVDNASVNLGKHNSIKSRVLRVNPNVYFLGCPCHISHNIGNAASSAFALESGFDIEEMAIDLYYWFDKSSKRKNSLADFCCFCDITYQQVVKHVSTRWLSLINAVERILKLYDGLRSYFLSAEEPQARFRRLAALFSNPITKLYLLFYKAVLSDLVKFNVFLQREDPAIYYLYPHCFNFLRKTFSKFIKISVLKNYPNLNGVPYAEPENQCDDDSLFIGINARQELQKLESEVSVTERKVEKFLLAVKKYYIAAARYMVAKLPLTDETLKRAKLVNFERREHAEYADVEYFVTRFNNFLKFEPEEIDAIHDEFIEYQLMEKDDIPSSVWRDAKEEIVDEETQAISEFTRMDIVWAYLSQIKSADGCTLKFRYLAKVAEIVLVLPHSNAGEERVFSMIKMNKTSYRSRLDLNGTLSSLIGIKMYDVEPCYKFNPSKRVLEDAKKATKRYNDEHSKK